MWRIDFLVMCSYLSYTLYLLSFCSSSLRLPGCSLLCTTSKRKGSKLKCVFRHCPQRCLVDPRDLMVRGVKSKQSFLAALKRLSSAETDLPLHRVNDLKHWEGGSWEAESFSLISGYIMCTPGEQVSVRPAFFWGVIAKNSNAHWKRPHISSPQWYYSTYCIIIQ